MNVADCVNPTTKLYFGVINDNLSVHVVASECLSLV